MLEVYSPLISSNRMTFKGWQSCSIFKWLIERGRHVKPWHDTFLYIGPVLRKKKLKQFLIENMNGKGTYRLKSNPI